MLKGRAEATDYVEAGNYIEREPNQVFPLVWKMHVSENKLINIDKHLRHPFKRKNMKKEIANGLYIR